MPESNLDQITKAYELSDHNKSVKTAFSCLKKEECRAEYTRFGTGLQLNDAGQDIKFDWRLFLTVGFYMLFAFIQGSLATVEQKPGLRLSMGLGIIFCIQEVQMLQDV